MSSDGSLVKMQTRPEVYLIDGGERHWIPDAATLTSKWSWSQVQTEPDGEVSAIPLGNPVPSVLEPGPWPDGALLIAPPDAPVYVIQGGTRHWVPDLQTFFANGYDWSAVETVPTAVLAAVPLGAPIPSVLNGPDHIVVDTGDQFLGSGHYMHSRAEFTRSTGTITGQTHIWTVTDLGGFHGGVSVIPADAADLPVAGWQPTTFRYGVDGRWIGVSDRTEPWPTTTVPADSRPAVVAIHVVQSWDPDSLQAISNGGAPRSVAELARQAGSVATVFTGTAG